MNIPVAGPPEPDRGHGRVQRRLRDVSEHDEIHVHRVIDAPGVETGAGAAGEDGPDPMPPEGVADLERHVAETGARRDLHKGLAVRRGRRRSVATRAFNSNSGPVSRRRNR